MREQSKKKRPGHREGNRRSRVNSPNEPQRPGHKTTGSSRPGGTSRTKKA